MVDDIFDELAKSDCIDAAGRLSKNTIYGAADGVEDFLTLAVETPENRKHYFVLLAG